MERPNIIDGRLHAPFFIFFRREPVLSDKEILSRFGLTLHRFAARIPPSSTYAVIADLDGWTMLADDWLYALWHKSSTRSAIESLAKTRDVMAWSVGDCDKSFEYCLYKSGKLVRQFKVDSPHFSDQIVAVNFGERLPFESNLLGLEVAIEEELHGLCSNLGIESIVTQEELRVYCKPYKSRLDPNAGIRNF